MSGWTFAYSLGLDQAERDAVDQLSEDGFTGKWLVFVHHTRAEEAWRIVRDATERGQLGFAAKIATEQRPGKDAMICVYTRDYRDREDVTRVLKALRELTFVGWLSYKEDCATLALRYGDGASLYTSAPGSTNYRQKREPYTMGDQSEMFQKGRSVSYWTGAPAPRKADQT